MDGAAGDEFDRADISLGTPPHALVVATSAGLHADSVSVVVEDLLIAHPGVSGKRHPLVRADVVFFETGTGGAVFSGASMGWTSCLSHEGYDNALARLTRNVLERFLDPAPFEAPS
jgi:N,N-dimethylformamidase